MPAKTKKPKEDLNVIEARVRKAAPEKSMTVPINMRGVYGNFENFYAVIGKGGLMYIVDREDQTIEMETYRALNPLHMAFNQKSLVELYNLYS